MNDELRVLIVLMSQLCFSLGVAYAIVHIYMDDIIKWFKKKFDKLKKMCYNIIRRIKGKSSPKKKANNTNKKE